MGDTRRLTKYPRRSACNAINGIVAHPGRRCRRLVHGASPVRGCGAANNGGAKPNMAGVGGPPKRGDLTLRGSLGAWEHAN